jgi:DNA-binding MarR family transcriptional regulator
MLEVLEQFRVIVKSIRQHYRDVEHRAGLTGAQLWALAQVAGHPGSQVGELARALAIHQSTASNLLRRLEGLGLVTRQRRGADQRHVQLFASKKGYLVLKRAPQPLIGVLQQALSELPSPALRDLHDHLARVIRLMKVRSLAARATPLSEM